MYSYEKKLAHVEKVLKPSEQNIIFIKSEEWEKIEKGELPKPKARMIVITPKHDYHDGKNGTAINP